MDTSPAPGPSKQSEPTEKALAAPATANKPAPPSVDPVNTAWPKLKNPPPGSVSNMAPASTKPSAKIETKTHAVGPPAAIPEGPGHTLGGRQTAGVTSGRGARPGGSQSADPEEIRKRRLAFLDNLQKKDKDK